MDSPTDVTFTYEIVDSPGQQTAKQAILWNEANLDDLLAAYNAHDHANIDTDDIAAAAKTGADTKIVTGTEGTDGNTAIWNADGDLVDGPTPPTGDIVGTTDTQTLTNKTIDGDDNTLQDIPYSAIKSTSRSGDDTTLVTGTAGTDGNAAQWNADGDLVDGQVMPASDIVGLTDTQTLTNKTIAVASNTITGLLGMFNGMVQRPSFAYKDADEIYINPGMYHHNGTSEQILSWNEQLTFQFGSGGSNANSEDLGVSEWHYLYIDDSELAGAVMVAGEFVNSTTAPTYSVTKHGRYNGNDRCIGAFLTNASSQIIEFYHDGGDCFFFADGVTDLSATDIDTTWTDVTLTAPSFATRMAITAQYYDSTAVAGPYAYWRTNGQTGTTGHVFGATWSDVDYINVNSFNVISDYSQVIEVKTSVSTAGTITIYTDAYYFPRGM